MRTGRNYESDDAYRLRKLMEHNQMLLEAHEMRRQEAEEVSRRMARRMREVLEEPT